MNNDNSYETAEVIELGKAQEIILGPKELLQEDNGACDPPQLFPCEFAKFDD